MERNPKRALLLLLSLFCHHQGSLHASEVFQPLPQAVMEKEQRLRLHRDPVWLAMLHYHPTISGSLRSHVLDRRFFLSPDGIRNPEAEIEEDIRRLLAGDLEFVCRFPLRSIWLSERLGLHLQNPEEACKGLKRWMDRNRAESITLVFPSANLSSPSSMFGHVLLRLDRDAGRESILDMSVTFAAKPPDDISALSYIIGNITGEFFGVYSIVPYYQKIWEYSSIGNRDIWEYRILLSQEEIKTILLHLWEVKDVTFEYYFANKNCAFRILELFDIIRPDMRLGWRVPMQVTPMGVIHTLKNAGLLREGRFRPSLAKRVDSAFQGLSPQEKQMALAISMHPDRPPRSFWSMSHDRKGKVLHAAFRIMQWNAYQLHKKPHYEGVLPLLGKFGEKGEPRIMPEGSPDSGHLPFRVYLKYGREMKKYAELSIRPAYHDSYDPSNGYDPGTHLDILDASLRWFGRRSLHLHELKVLEMESLVPYKRYRPSLSWNGALLLMRTPLEEGYHLVGEARFHAGVAENVPGIGLFAFLAGVSARVHNSSRNRWIKPGVQIYYGSNIGISIRYSHYFSMGSKPAVDRMDAHGSVSISKSGTLGFGIMFKDKVSKRRMNMFVGYAHYW